MGNPTLSFFSPEMVYEFDLGKYTSLRWRPMYDSPGEFELHASTDLLQYVRRGQLILRPDRPKESVRIEGIKAEESGLIITGRFLSAILGDAAVRSIHNYSGETIENAMQSLVVEEYGRVPRTIPLKPAPAAGFAQTITAQVSLKNLLTVEQAMAKAGGLGFRIWADPAIQSFWFEVYAGVDRTEGQEENPRVVFSDEYHNIDKPEYQEAEETYKNFAIVCGAGEGTDRTIVEVDCTNGEDRRELLVDARDLSKGDQTADQYRETLRQRGLDKLAELARVRSFAAGIKSSSQFQYIQDWNLGDIVTAKHGAWGVTMDQRVAEIEEVYERDAVTVTPTMGNPAPESFKLEDNL